MLNNRKLAEDEVGGFLQRHPLRLTLVLLILFSMAAAARLYRLQTPGVLLERDLGSAILARDLFYQHTDTVPQWRKETSATMRANLPLLEPPVTEYIVSLLYRLVGQEQLWMARLLTSFFWLAGGIFLYKIARTFISTEGAVAVLAFYLLAPLSIFLSRSFQPDALMMLMWLASLFWIIKFYQEPSTLKLTFIAALTALTVLHRPIVLFTLFAAFAALGVAKQRSWKGAFRPQSLLFFTIALLPSVLYHGYGALITDGLQAAMSFQPFLVLEKEYWRGWLDLSLQATGMTALVAALLGLALLPRGWPKAMLTGMWSGYIVFGLVFAYHVHTHGYYHAQLVPLVALSFGTAATLVYSQLQASADRWYGSVAVIAIIALALVIDFRQIRATLTNQHASAIVIAKTVGQLVHHSDRVVYVATNYGVLLQYYGELTGTHWPRRITIPLYQSPEGLPERNVEERLTTLGFVPEYFVITDLNQYNIHHADLKDYLRANCSLLAGGDGYLIYADCAY